MSLIFKNGSRTQTFGPQGNGMFPEWGSSAGGQPGAGYGQGQQAGGRQGSQAGSGLAAYAPGRAQPRQPQSQGTPFQAYSDQQNSQKNDSRWGAGNWAYSQASPGNAQPQVSQGATGIDGQRFSSPSQAFTQRDALIQRINQSRAPMFAGAGTYQGNGTPPPSWGQKPQMDFNTLMGQANQMASSGWSNPFSQPKGGSGSQQWSPDQFKAPARARQPVGPQQPGDAYDVAEPQMPNISSSRNANSAGWQEPPDERAVAAQPQQGGGKMAYGLRDESRMSQYGMPLPPGGSSQYGGVQQNNQSPPPAAQEQAAPDKLQAAWDASGGRAAYEAINDKRYGSGNWSSGYIQGNGGGWIRDPRR